MIDRTFDGLKFERTYMGGSKKREKQILDEVQGTEEKEYEDCDWIGFRNALTTHYDDKLNVIFSWRYLFKNLSCVVAIIALFFVGAYFYHNLNQNFLWVIGGTVLLSVIFHITYLIYLNKQESELRDYDLGLSICIGEIEKTTGITFKKNP